jgi:hypothetical protein
MSEAFFSAIRANSLSMIIALPEREGAAGWRPGNCLVAQEFVDAGLGAGLGVDLLDDDGAVQAVLAIG